MIVANDSGPARRRPGFICRTIGFAALFLFLSLSAWPDMYKKINTLGLKCREGDLEACAELADIARNEKDGNVRLAAASLLGNARLAQLIFADIAKNDADGTARLGAVKKLSDRALLADIAEHAKDGAVREEAKRALAAGLPGSEGGSAETAPVAAKPAPPPPAAPPPAMAPAAGTVPLAQECLPLLGFTQQAQQGNFPVVAIEKNALLLACSGMRFSSEVFIFKDFDYENPLAIIRSSASSMFFMPDRPELMIGTDPAFKSPGVQAWDTQSWQELGKIKDCSKICFAPDGKRFAAVRGREVVLSNTADGTPVWSLPLSDKSRLPALAISPDSKKLAFADRQSLVEVSLSDGKEICRSETLATNCASYFVARLQYSADSTRLLAGVAITFKEATFFKSAKTATKIVDLESGDLSRARDLDGSFLFSLSPDGKKLATIREGELKVLSYPGGKPLLTIPPVGTLYDLLWTPDSQILLTLGTLASSAEDYKVVYYPQSTSGALGALFSKKKGKSACVAGQPRAGTCSAFLRRWRVI